MNIQISMQKEHNLLWLYFTVIWHLVGNPAEQKITNLIPLKVQYNMIAYPLLFDLRPRFWHSLCTYALSTDVNDDGNSSTEAKK